MRDPNAVTITNWKLIKEMRNRKMATIEKITDPFDHPDQKPKPKENVSWIQTFSGRRFNPLDPYVDAIVIQDIAHALAYQCRFSGHVKEFYSVAQHSVLVSYICDREDAFWGLMHDASEAYLVDIPRPLKRSGKFDAYLQFEEVMQAKICQRFDLPKEEPESVKIADKLLLSTEARDLMAPLHSDWIQPTEPLPFKIEPLMPKDAEQLFLKRFDKLFIEHVRKNGARSSSKG